MLLKAGAVRLHHFAHLSADLCASADHEAETDAHRAGKFVTLPALFGWARHTPPSNIICPSPTNALMC
ncbi:MAG: hypothetical protein HC793_01160, partial [Aquincola sp.]|nr:hypothetical protein [Aquincola sp.]